MLKKLVLNFRINNGIDTINVNDILNEIPKPGDNFIYNPKIAVYVEDRFKVFYNEKDFDSPSFPSVLGLDIFGGSETIKPNNFYWTQFVETDYLQISWIQDKIDIGSGFDVTEEAIELTRYRNLVLNFYGFYHTNPFLFNNIGEAFTQKLLNGKPVIAIRFYDLKTLDEIKQISEYTIKPISD